jgi:hypothetical protein
VFSNSQSIASNLDVKFPLVNTQSVEHTLKQSTLHAPESSLNGRSTLKSKSHTKLAGPLPKRTVDLAEISNFAFGKMRLQDLDKEVEYSQWRKRIGAPLTIRTPDSQDQTRSIECKSLLTQDNL